MCNVPVVDFVLVDFVPVVSGLDMTSMDWLLVAGRLEGPGGSAYDVSQFRNKNQR